MPQSTRYTRTAIALHWLIAIAVVLQFTWGWWMQTIAKAPPGPRADAFNLHKSIGLTLLALMLIRLLWRWSNAPPPLPAMPAWQGRLAHLNHALLYFALFTMPLAGYLGSVFSGYPVRYFGVALPAWGSQNPALKDLCSGIHLGASWMLAGAVAVHVAAALKHALIDRDGLMARMGIGSAPK